MPSEWLRATEELRDAVRTHRIQGYPVRVPVFGEGTISHQTQSPGGGYFYFAVKPEKPMPFEDFVRQRGIDDRQMTESQWRERYDTVPAMTVELLERLEKGGTVSNQDREFFELRDRGCLNERQEVICDTFEIRNIEIPKTALKEGMMVAFEDENKETYSGRIVGLGDHPLDPTTVLLELFTPIPFMETPLALRDDALEPGFYAPETIAALGYGTVKAWEITDTPLPPGRWVKPAWEDEDVVYYLDKPISRRELEGICEGQPPECINQSLTMFILPLDINKGMFRPLPENLDPHELVYGVDIEA